jgi:hypothetical protein
LNTDGLTEDETDMDVAALLTGCDKGWEEDATKRCGSVGKYVAMMEYGESDATRDDVEQSAVP